MDNTPPEKSILIIEDEEPLRHALISKLSEDTFRIIEASNGEDGIKQALEQHPDLIILDLLMPRMDGIEFLSDLKQDPWGATAKVIILSNLSEQEVVSHAQALIGYPYFEKSKLQLQDFFETVQNLLGKKIAVQTPD